MFSFIVTFPVAYAYSAMLREQNKRTAGRRNSRKFAALNSPKPFSLDTKASTIRSVHFQPALKNVSQANRESCVKIEVDQNHLRMCGTQDPVVNSNGKTSKAELHAQENVCDPPLRSVKSNSSGREESSVSVPDQYALTRLAEFLKSINIGSKDSSTTTIAEDERPYTDDDLEDEIENVCQGCKLNPQNSNCSNDTMIKCVESDVMLSESALSCGGKMNSVSRDAISITRLVDKPGEDDFVLPPLPPPPSEEDLLSCTTQSSNSSKADSPPPQTSLTSPTYKATSKYSVWTPSATSKNTNGVASDGARKSPVTAVPTGFRSVARPVSKKPDKGPATSTVTTSYTIPSKGLPQTSENVRITPNNELPQGAVYETQTLEGNVLHTDTYYPTPSGEKTVLERTKKTTIIRAEHHGGMGPTDGQGVPVALRSTVDNPKQWYKNMFKQIHKFDREEEEHESSHSTAYDMQEERPTVSQTPSYKPKKLGRITDYTPSNPYVVENKPHHEKIPEASTSFKPVHAENNKQAETTRGQEPVHGTEYHEKDYMMADYVITEPKHVVHINPTKPKETKAPGIRKTAKAKFRFVAQNEKQLGLKKDQIVIVTREINKDWYEGETTDGKRQGMFPVAYVQIIAGQSESKGVKKGLAKVKFDFNGTNPKLLSVKKGDSIELLEKVDKNWYKGALGQKNGLIPANYLEVVREPEQPKASASQQKEISTSKPTSSVDKASNFNQYFHPSSVPSSSSNNEPDDREKMSKASYLAHAVVNSGAQLSKPKFTRGEYDIPEFEDEAMGLSSPPPQESNPAPVDHVTKNSVDTTTSMISNDFAQNLNVSEPVSSTPSDNANDFDDEFPVKREKYICTYGYNPQNEDELELMPGDVIQVVEKCDDGWYVGTCERTGGFGTFPGNYVEPGR